MPNTTSGKAPHALGMGSHERPAGRKKGMWRIRSSSRCNLVGKIGDRSFPDQNNNIVDRYIMIMDRYTKSNCGYIHFVRYTTLHVFSNRKLCVCGKGFSRVTRTQRTCGLRTAKLRGDTSNMACLCAPLPGDRKLEAASSMQRAHTAPHDASRIGVVCLFVLRLYPLFLRSSRSGASDCIR